MDDQIDPGDPFFGINLSDCVTVAANSPSNAKAIHRAMAFVAEQASQSSGLQGIDQQAIAQSWNNALQAIPIMDSIVGLKAANAHLTRQLAAQALAHAEQMEGAQRRVAGLETQISMQDSIYADRPGTLFSARQKIATERDVALARVAELEMQDRAWARIVDQQQTDIERVREDYNYEVRCGNEWFAKYNELESKLAMRVTPVTQPTDAQQTASDVKAAPERRPDGTLKPVARAWEAPKRLTDVRRLGG